eukprot:CAMPEP_0177621988 /NCGR_PEP_ID=MMETSP0419_2-20121207/27965_1 /TAXON_ID=582737 /ORGANISM="Tetraselmis sp., Strain GSL018" /LENGTH=427 /DNA_ID=CAMNT_0019122115 /DNA_START=118 /DNA_END=1397 /DNA_ORIENTATION=+
MGFNTVEEPGERQLEQPLTVNQDEREDCESHSSQPFTPKTEGLGFRELLPSVYLPALVSNVGRQLVTPVLPIFAKETLGLNDAAVGTLVSLEGLGGVAVNIPAGSFVSRFGSVRTSVVSALVQSGSSVLAAVSVTPFELSASRFLSGVSLSGWNMARQFFLANAVQGSNRGKAMSLIGATIRIGQTFGPLGGGVLADKLGVRSVFFAQAAVAAVTCALVVIFMSRYDSHDDYGPRKGGRPEGEGGAGEEPAPRARARSCTSALCPYGDVIASCWRELLSAGFFCLLLSMIRQSRALLIPLVGHDLGLSKSAIGTVQAVGAVVDSSLFMVAGWMNDRYGRKWSGILSTAVLCGAFAVLSAARSLPMLVGASVLAGVGNGFSSGIINLLGADTSAAAGPRRGEYLGLFRTLSDAGVMAGPFVAGCISSL